MTMRSFHSGLVGVSCAVILCAGCATLDPHPWMAPAEPICRPSPGKALVRIHNPKPSTHTEYVWDGTRLVGVSTGRTVIDYECKPGRRLFSITSEKRTVKAELEPGEVFDLVVRGRTNILFGGTYWKLVAVAEDPLLRGRADLFLKDEQPIGLDRSRVDPDKLGRLRSERQAFLTTLERHEYRESQGLSRYETGEKVGIGIQIAGAVCVLGYFVGKAWGVEPEEYMTLGYSGAGVFVLGFCVENAARKKCNVRWRESRTTLLIGPRGAGLACRF